MLVLTRKSHEGMMIGEDIEVRVLAIDYDRKQVRIGISAPDGVRILRDELVERYQRDKMKEAWEQ